MIIYRYIIAKTDKGYNYTSDTIDTLSGTPAAKSLAQFIDDFEVKFDKPIHIELLDNNAIFFLFNSKEAFNAFEDGISFQFHIDENFNKLNMKNDESNGKIMRVKGHV